jgi:hypothetical protein
MTLRPKPFGMQLADGDAPGFRRDIGADRLGGSDFVEKGLRIDLAFE